MQPKVGDFCVFNDEYIPGSEIIQIVGFELAHVKCISPLSPIPEFYCKSYSLTKIKDLTALERVIYGFNEKS